MSADKEKETLLLLILYWVHKKYPGKGERPTPVTHPVIFQAPSAKVF